MKYGKNVTEKMMKRAGIHEYDLCELDTSCYINNNGHLTKPVKIKTSAFRNEFDLITFLETLPTRPYLQGIYKRRGAFYVRIFVCDKHGYISKWGFTPPLEF